MLLHAFLDRVGAGWVFAPLCAPGQPRFDDLALVAATTGAFALGVGSVEAIKHVVRVQLGPLLNLYFVDDHFVPYEGAKPVGKGYNTTRRHVQKGLADTQGSDYAGRAVWLRVRGAFGLTKTLPAALAELRKATGQAKIMLGFDCGGAYASVFAHCRDTDVDWIIYRRGGLAAVTAEPARHWRVDAHGATESITLADEMVTINDYGRCHQLTLFENGQPTLQVLTSDLSAPAVLLAWLRCRRRIENVFKYLTAHHGIDWLCHYGADIGPDTTLDELNTTPPHPTSPATPDPSPTRSTQPNQPLRLRWATPTDEQGLLGRRRFR
jgi:hypothetical protein